jgi:hypothetical protein
VEVFETASTRVIDSDLVRSVSYNRRPAGLDDTVSNPSVSYFPMQLSLAQSLPQKSETISNSVTTEVCVLIVDVA